jgi:hypothetical protein
MWLVGHDLNNSAIANLDLGYLWDNSSEGDYGIHDCTKTTRSKDRDSAICSGWMGIHIVFV